MPAHRISYTASAQTTSLPLLDEEFDRFDITSPYKEESGVIERLMLEDDKDWEEVFEEEQFEDEMELI